MKNLAVFVNSSDGFDDCWAPFFQLYDRFGGNLRNAPLYLNTERKNYAWPELNVHATRVWPNVDPVRPTWSECLLRGLNTIREPFVLYLQEDYFLTQPVDCEWLEKALKTLDENPEVGVIYLNRYGPQFKRSRQSCGGFVEIQRPVSYLLSTQAAIWRKEVLLSLTRPWENGWMFEKFGSCRARQAEKKFYSVNREIMENRPVFDYIYTGIIKGQWKNDCVSLFRQHEIDIDFSRRGFYQERGRLKSRFEVFKKLFGNPLNAMRSLWTLV